MQRGTPSSTATSAAPSKGTSSQPSRRAARAGYSAVRSGEDVKMALSTSSGWKPFACCNARSSSSVALRIASLVLAVAVVAPRSPRRVLLMALADQWRLMVLTDADLLKGRDPVEACRRAVAGGATMIQVRLKDAAPREVLILAVALVGALAVPILVNDRVDVALAAAAAGAQLRQDDPPLDRLRPRVAPRRRGTARSPGRGLRPGWRGRAARSGRAAGPRGDRCCRTSAPRGSSPAPASSAGHRRSSPSGPPRAACRA